MNDERELNGKVALVLGGSRGIGAGVVRRLAADGARLAFTYAASAESAEALAAEVVRDGGAAIAIRADSGEPAQIEAAVARTLAEFGRLDILAVNAGILQLATIDTYALDDFDRMVAVNVRGVFVALRYAAPHLPAGGRIITIGSNVAERVGFPGAGVYAMTKAAVAALVRGAAIDLAPRGVTVNNIQPGPTATDMTADHAGMVLPLVPLGRMGEPREIAGLVSYLAREEAGFVTGASLTIDGGYSA
ncbi:SDR family oxidoreductase [Phenylobacterium sp.]|uniref:SDR family oxidoreductase n=1 Tax=Phenylobacterium sp. TaxID=1871053 RepID=UPI0035B38641